MLCVVIQIEIAGRRMPRAVGLIPSLTSKPDLAHVVVKLKGRIVADFLHAAERRTSAGLRSRDTIDCIDREEAVPSLNQRVVWPLGKSLAR
jgi:hypothetical protein